MIQYLTTNSVLDLFQEIPVMSWFILAVLLAK